MKSIVLTRHVALSAILVAGLVTAIEWPQALAAQVPSAVQPLPTFPVQGAVHMVIGPTSNAVVHAGQFETVIVDTQTATSAEGLLAAIKSVTTKPIRYVVNTHFHAPHTGGNVVITKAGSTVPGNTATGLAAVRGAAQRASLVAHENVLLRLSALTGQDAVPFDALPTESFALEEDEIFTDEPIVMIHQPAAHTDGDVIVFFRRSDVIATGDVFSTVNYPIVDAANGGTINGLLAALNQIIVLTVPKDKQEGGTYVIPGRGRVSDEADVVEYRDMVTIIRDRVQDLKAKGMTAEQVKAAKVTVDYDPRYATSEWTPDMFVEAIYRTLPASGSTARNER